MRKVQDHYFKKARRAGYPARSVYKLEQAQKKYRLLKRGDSVLDLGCQPGSWSLFAAEVIGPKGVVVGIDLKDGELPARSGAAKIHRLRGDINDPDSLKSITDIRPRFRVVLSDIAPSTSGNKWVDQQRSLRLARQVLAIAGQLLLPKGNFYCKVFEGEEARDFQYEAQKHYKCRRIRPEAVRQNSREWFLVGVEKKTDPLPWPPEEPSGEG